MNARHASPLFLSLLLLLVPMYCPATQESIWPDDLAGGDSGPQADYYELGTIFRASVPGKVTHLRVFALAGESGDHTAYLWRNSDNALIGGPYTWNYGGSTNGWVTFDIPDVTIAADTDYTVSVSNGDTGQFPFTWDALVNPGTNGRHLSYPSTAGVSTTTAGVRPTGSYRSSNYYRDVVFEPLNPPSGSYILVLGDGHFIAPGDTTPGALDRTHFGSAGVNSGFVEQSFAVFNDGSVDLQLTGNPKVGISGVNASDFSVIVQPASSIAAGNSNSFTVRFAPTGVGVRSATLTIANNDTEKSSYSFAIQGNGVIANGESLLADSKVGNDSGPAGQTYELGTIFRSSTAGKIMQLRVYALATETGDHIARIWRNSDDTVIGGPYTWTYGGASGWMTLTIPEVTVEADTDYTVTISTGGGGANFPYLPSDFANPGNNGNHLSWPANAGVFSTAVGTRPTEFFNGNNYLRDIVFVPEGTVITAPDMEISGNGIVIVNGQTTTKTADGTDVGRTAVPGGAIERTFTISNKGNAPLSLTGSPAVNISGAQASDFTVVSQPASPIAAGGTTTFTIRFVPSAIGARRATVSVANNSVKNPYAFNIAGAGTTPGLESIFSDTKTPGGAAEDGVRYELGTVFRASVVGTITHIRVYATAQESGEHTAYIWRNSDNTMIGGPYAWTYGGTAGWITLAIPEVAIEADVDYTVSVSTGNSPGWYPFIANDLAAAGTNGEHLSYPVNGGTLTLSAGTRPDTSSAANFMRDVVFVPQAFKITAVTPNMVTGDVTISWTGDGTSFQVQRALTLGGSFTSIGSPQPERSFTDPGVLHTNAQVFYRISK